MMHACLAATSLVKFVGKTAFRDDDGFRDRDGGDDIYQVPLPRRCCCRRRRVTVTLRSEVSSPFDR